MASSGSLPPTQKETGRKRQIYNNATSLWVKNYHTLRACDRYTVREVSRWARDRDFKYADAVMQQQGLNLRRKGDAADENTIQKKNNTR